MSENEVYPYSSPQTWNTSKSDSQAQPLEFQSCAHKFQSRVYNIIQVMHTSFKLC